MDKSLIGGSLAATALIVGSILIAPGGSLKAFIDYPSLGMVIGGPIAIIFVALPFSILKNLPGVMRKLMFPNAPQLAPVIRQLVQFAEVARREGILALESRTDEIKDPFMLLGIQMAIDGTDSELMEVILRSEMEAVARRHKNGKFICDTIGRYAPAFGMIGTLVGLVIMLGNMDDPAAIGPGMAVALLTTLYGALVSNCMFLPYADKLSLVSKQELEVREMIVRGILSIQEGDNPRVLEQKLQTALPANQRTPSEKEAA